VVKRFRFTRTLPTFFHQCRQPHPPSSTSHGRAQQKFRNFSPQPQFTLGPAIIPSPGTPALFMAIFYFGGTRSGGCAAATFSIFSICLARRVVQRSCHDACCTRYSSMIHAVQGRYRESWYDATQSKNADHTCFGISVLGMTVNCTQRPGHDVKIVHRHN